MAYTKADLEKQTIPSVQGANFNANSINIEDLTYNLNLALKQSQPKNFIDGFFKSRQVTLGKDRINDLLSLVDKVMEANQKVSQAQAEIAISSAMVQHIMNSQAVKATQELELLKREHKDELQEIEDRARARNLQLMSLENTNKVTEKTIAHIQSQIDNLTKQGDAIAHKIRNTEMSGAELANIIANLKDTSVNDNISKLTQDLREQEAIYAERMANVGVIMQKARLEEAKANREFVQFDVDEFAKNKAQEKYK